MVAKYSDLLMSISEWAYIIRLRAVVCMLNEDKEDVVDEQRVMGASVMEGVSEGDICFSELNRSRQTNRTSPVSRNPRVSWIVRIIDLDSLGLSSDASMPSSNSRGT